MSSTASDRRFIRACRRQPVDRVPVWMMRQAGRYQPEYRALKDRVGGFWELCRSPEAIAEATLFAQRSLDTDAAIIFSDITLPAWAMGLELEFTPGPKFSKAVQTDADIAALEPLRAEKVDFLLKGVEQTRAGLADDVSLIGFVGAPLTLAGYMIEGYPSRGWTALKRMAYGEPQRMAALLNKVTEAVITHARIQVEAGCDAVQLFDSTAGELAAYELHHFAFDSARRVIEALRPLGVPIIYFARNIGAHLEPAASVGADVLGLDWTVSVERSRRRLGDEVALQGNMDPGILFCAPEVIEARVNAILEQARGMSGFVFNLGHGILPETPPEHAKKVVEVVHAWK